MDSIWFRFSVETMVTNGHGRKLRRKSQGENRGRGAEADIPSRRPAQARSVPAAFSARKLA